MENKINIAELLRNCPKGMELDCTMFDNVTFEGLNTEDYPINIKVMGDDCYKYLTKTGCWNNNDNAKCVIFPKGKTTWEGFKRPFKDGDILISGLEDCCNPFIFKQTNGFGNAQCYCAINCYKGLALNSDNWTPIKGCRFATEEEKQKLFDAIKSNGYKWNEKNKTLEKLVEPKFKVGDRIVKKNSICTPILITKVGDGFYYSNTKSPIEVLPIEEQDNYELVPNKFVISTLKPFESRVLVRDYNHQCWGVSFFGYFDKFMGKFDTVRGVYIQCIPYEGNEHLLGTTNDCEDFYKTWEL